MEPLLPPPELGCGGRESQYRSLGSFSVGEEGLGWGRCWEVCGYLWNAPLEPSGFNRSAGEREGGWVEEGEHLLSWEYLCRRAVPVPARGAQRYLRFLGKRQSGQISLKTNKAGDINDESGMGLDVFAFRNS